MFLGATNALAALLLLAPSNPNAADPNRVGHATDPNVRSHTAPPLSDEDREILENLEFFRLFQLLRDLKLFTETP